MRAKRLQGKAWEMLRQANQGGLRLLGISKSLAGNYRADVLCLNDGLVYYHWLSKKEAERLEGSKWMESHEPIPLDDLYKDGFALVRSMHKNKEALSQGREDSNGRD